MPKIFSGQRGRCRVADALPLDAGTDADPRAATRRLVARSISARASASDAFGRNRTAAERARRRSPDRRPIDLAEEIGFAQPTLDQRSSTGGHDAGTSRTRGPCRVGAEQRRDRMKMPAMVLGLVMRLTEEHAKCLEELRPHRLVVRRCQDKPMCPRARGERPF